MQSMFRCSLCSDAVYVQKQSMHMKSQADGQADLLETNLNKS